MPLSRAPLNATAFAVAACASLLAAYFAVTLIEDNTETEVRFILDRNGLSWAEVEADGLRVLMGGTAPSEALRFRALSLAGSMVDAERVIDEMEVAAAAEVMAPYFSAEILRNSNGLTVVGLIPESSDSAAVIAGFSSEDDTQVTNLIETANYPAPAGWDDALSFAMRAIKDLPRAKVSVDAGRVAITAIGNDAADKAAMEARLRRMAPPALTVTLNISAPRPIISPFALRFVKDETGARFDTCSADTAATHTRIMEAAMRAGLTGPGRCTIGMGVPSHTWVEAVELAIDAVARLSAGTVTFSDAELTLAAAEGTDAALFDRIVGELEASLPDVFALKTVLPRGIDTENGPPEFVATLSPEGQVQLRGRISGGEMRDIIDSYAKARFGSDSVYTAARAVSDLPADWPVRVITGIEALGYLDNGAATVTPDVLYLSGRSGNPDAGDAVSRLIVEKLGDDSVFNINVSYVEALDPVQALPTPEECESEIAAIIDAEKIRFEPSSTTIDPTSMPTMDAIAKVLMNCGNIRLEVQGHTDSQGREQMNLALSQARAESVLNELRARRVLTRGLVAKGYGETQPIDDNATEAGREANRRISFLLIRPEPSIPEGEQTLETLAETDKQAAGEEEAEE